MDRRDFLTTSVLAIAGASVAARVANPLMRAVRANGSDDKDAVTVIGFDDSGKKLGPAQVKKVRKTDAQMEAATHRRTISGYAQDGHRKSLYRPIRRVDGEGTLSLHLLQQRPVQLRNQV